MLNVLIVQLDVARGGGHRQGGVHSCITFYSEMSKRRSGTEGEGCIPPPLDAYNTTLGHTGSEGHSKRSGGIYRKAPTSFIVLFFLQLSLANIFVQEGRKRASSYNHFKSHSRATAIKVSQCQLWTIDTVFPSKFHHAILPSQTLLGKTPYSPSG